MIHISPSFTQDDLLDEQVTNIIANQHFAPPPDAFNLDDTLNNSNEDECIDGLHNDEEHQSFEIEDEGDEEDCIRGSEDEHAADDDLTNDQGDDDGFSIEDVNDEEYQSNEMDMAENIQHNQYGRRRIGILIAVCSLVLICFVAGVGASNKGERERYDGSASAIENVEENNVAATPSECISKATFEIAMEDEVEEFDCNLDSICNDDVGACDGNTGIVCYGACNSPGGCTDNQGEIQSCSCSDSDACDRNSGDIGLFSCNGKHACKKNKGDIGTLSCNGNSRACFGNNGNVESESCNGLQACLENHGSISFKSCSDFKSCHLNEGPVGEESCNGQESCMKNYGTIGRKSW